MENKEEIKVEEVPEKTKEVIESSPETTKEKTETSEEKKEEVPVEQKFDKKTDRRDDDRGIAGWEPKTKLGRSVKDGKIKTLDEILDGRNKILEAEIIDFITDIKSDLINIGQSKGKFGGGKRRIWRQTQRKTKEGNVPTFSTLAVVGDEDGHVGIGSGKSMETLPAREKAVRKAKLEIFKVKRACAGFDCSCSEAHTVPFKVTGKAGSLRLTLIPAAQGTGLVVADELKKVLRLAGIKDVYSRASGKKRTTFNLVKSCIDALKKTNETIKSKPTGGIE
ncbi:MAG: 30S ribosomal protein S5 [Candidatus Pacearchaeota archaeon]